MKIHKIGLYCGAKLLRISDWKMYGFFRVVHCTDGSKGFSIGPVLFWSGC